MAEGVRSSHSPDSPASEGALTTRTQNPPAVERARDQTPGPSEEAKSAPSASHRGRSFHVVFSRFQPPRGVCDRATGGPPLYRLQYSRI